MLTSALLAGFVALGLRAQTPPRADAEFMRQGYDRYREMTKTSPHGSLSWSFLGPTNISGRATDVDVAQRGTQRRIYAAYATSGVWKTDDNGTTWQAVFEHMPSTSIGDIAVAPSNPDIVWVGTGESNIFRASMAGTGIYRSADAGRTWEHMGLTDSQTIARIVVHPTNPQTVYVAASGHEWTDNETRGVFKTTDGGRTWTPLSAGLPEPRFRGRIGLAIARSNPKVLYAFIDNYEEGRAARPNELDAYGRPIVNGRIKSAEVYRSDDAGAAWRKVTETNDFMIQHSGTYGWVFGQIRVDPTDENTIYTLGIGLHVSRDAGKTFTTLPDQHGDHHGLWIDPANPRILYNSNDGGFSISENGGQTWKFAQSVSGTQFYNVTLDMGTPFKAYGSIQDIGSRRGTIDLSKGRDAIAPVAFEGAPGGEGSHHAIDPTHPSIVYSHGFYGNFSRADVSQTGGRGRGFASTNIQPKDTEDLRAQWMAPVILSPTGPSTVYLGYQFLFRSPNRGADWQKISPDLTSRDPAQMLPRNSSAIPYQTIVAISESPKNPNVIYAGTDDGRLHVTSNQGREWTDLTSRLPVRKWISRVVASEHVEGTVYVTQRGREDDDFAAYVYKSTDSGRTFTSITSGIPAGSVNVIREDPANPNVLFVGTDFGVFVSTNGGVQWHVLGSNLPSVQVSDLQYHPRDKFIVISTYGRGMWGMDATKIK